MKTINIAGAGIIGLASAWRLAQRGWRVQLFDAGRVAGEASRAAAGMLAPGGEIDSDAALAAMALRSLGMYPEFVRDLEEESGFIVEYKRCGAVEVATDAAALAALTEKATRQARIGIASEPCEHNGFAARRYAGDAAVDPRSITEALLAACRLRGVTVHEHEPVVEVMANGERIRTARGEYAGDRLLVASGAWSSTLLPGLPKSYPVRGHLLHFDMEPGLLPPILRGGHTYLLQRDSGGLIAGSNMERVGFDRTVDDAAVADIHRRAAALLPALADATPTDIWNGFRPAVDGGPVIGRFGQTSVWTAYGHFRNGVLLAPDTAHTIAEEMTE